MKNVMFVSALILALASIGCGKHKKANAPHEVSSGGEVGALDCEPGDLECQEFLAQVEASRAAAAAGQEPQPAAVPQDGAPDLTVTASPQATPAPAPQAQAPVPPPPPPTPVWAPVTAAGVQPALVVAPPLGNPREGCLHGYTLFVQNTSGEYQEVQAEAIMPCGNAGTVDLYVMQRNGGVRLAKLIPPGGAGSFYFDPLRGGTGEQHVRVVGYAAAHVFGSPTLPAPASGHIFTFKVRTPRDKGFRAKVSF